MLSPIEAERNTSAALIRCDAAKNTEKGYNSKALEAFMISNVLKGSG